MPSFTDIETEVYLNKLNPENENSFIIYRNRSIIDKFIDFKPTAENFKLLANILDTNKGNYFDLE